MNPFPFLVASILVVTLASACGDSKGGSAPLGDGDSPGDGDDSGGDGDNGDGDDGDGGSQDDADAQGDGDTSFPVIPGDYNLSVSENPLKAVLTYDEPRSVSKEFELAGGTLSATGSDGTRYVLTIDDTAMPYPARISMTPVASMGGVPIAGEPHGVRLEPDGFEFVAPVRLEVLPAAGTTWQVDHQIPLSITGSEQIVSLGLIEPDQMNFAFTLRHFSSYVMLLAEKGMNASLSQSDIRSRFGGAEEQRLQSAAAEILGRERQKALLGSEDGEVLIMLEPLLAQFEEKVLKVRLAKAGESCAASKLALQTLLAYERQRQLLGFESTQFSDTLAALLKSSAILCMKEEYEICRDENIVTRILPT